MTQIDIILKYSTTCNIFTYMCVQQHQTNSLSKCLNKKNKKQDLLHYSGCKNHWLQHPEMKPPIQCAQETFLGGGEEGAPGGTKVGIWKSSRGTFLLAARWKRRSWAAGAFLGISQGLLQKEAAIQESKKHALQNSNLTLYRSPFNPYKNSRFGHSH